MRSLLTPDFLSAEFRAVVLGLPEMTEENTSGRSDRVAACG